MPESAPPSENPTNLPPTAAPEGLPEEFVLTPELVEEEAIRGDFVLRWAAILLAVLVACTTISQTETLVHIKSGQYLAANGIIPDGTEPFAYTTEGRTWRNHSWLFDLMLAGAYGIGGDIGLTVFKALLAGITFWCVVRISRPQTPTWWNAMIAAAGAVACVPFFKAMPELVTLLGCAVTLSLLNSWRYHGRDKLNIKLPIVFLLWANLDPRMFLGLLLLVLFAAGESLRRRERSDAPLLPKRTLWITVAACFGVTLLNPFGWHALAMPWKLYAQIDPLFRSLNPQFLTLDALGHYNLSHPAWWEVLTIPFVTALSLGGLALISLYLNFSKLSLPDLLILPVFVGLAYLTGREIGPAVVVACVIINLNCQDWYRESFNQTYSVKKFELLFSRGGRALTVLAFVGLSWITMKGFVYRGYGDRVGFGFENILAGTLTGLREELSDQFDDRPFNFTAAQGDTLIWTDRNVFLDSRLELFTGEGEDDLIAVHNRTRWAMLLKDPEDERTGKPDVWRATFDRFGITHVLPRLARLAGFGPDYLTYNMLMIGGEFQLTQLGPSAGVFYRKDSSDPELRKYLNEHQVNFIAMAFQSDVPEIPPRTSFPQPRDVYDKYLRAERAELPRDLALATHYEQYLEQASRGAYRIDPRFELALAYLSIRGCLRSLATDDGFDNPITFRLLGRTYTFLQIIESNLCAQNGVRYDPSMRYYQAMFAFRQSLIVDPDNLQGLELLRDLYVRNEKIDFALEIAQQLENRYAKDAALSESDAGRANRELIRSLESRLTPVREYYEKVIADKQADNLQVAQALLQGGFYHLAKQYLDQVEESKDRNHPAYFMRGKMLFENGYLEQSFETLLEIEELSTQGGAPQGLHQAAWAYLVNGDFASAISRWKKERELMQVFPIKQMLDTSPLVSDESALNDDTESWYLARYLNFARSLESFEETQATLWWLQAMAHLEAGENKEATAALESLLRVAPDTQMRRFVAFYLLTIADLNVDPLPPSERIPVSIEMFAAESEAPAAPPEGKN